MALRVSNITLRVEEPETLLPGKIAKTLSVAVGDISAWRILRKSLDARDKQSLLFVYSIEVQVNEEQSVFKQAVRRRFHSQPVELYSEEPFELPPIGGSPLKHRPIVIGSGPAGLAAAYFLAERGFQPLLLERGRKVRDRIHDVKAFDEGGPFQPDSNYLFGEGGAGTFSDGKLTYRGSGPDVKRILQLFADNKGKPSILYDYRPHLGSNRLPAVVKSLRKNIQALGGEVVFNCKVEDFDIRDNSIHGVYTSSGFFPADCVILAIGHSARDTYQALHAKNILLEQKPFQMGVRIEQPQETANRVKYGPAKLENVIGAADYSLVANGKYDLFTFSCALGDTLCPAFLNRKPFAQTA